MEDHAQLLPSFNFVPAGTDTSPKVFGLIDELGANFKEEFDLAKAAHGKGEKAAKHPAEGADSKATKGGGEASSEEGAEATAGEEAVLGEEAVAEDTEAAPAIELSTEDLALLDDGAVEDASVLQAPEVVEDLSGQVSVEASDTTLPAEEAEAAVEAAAPVPTESAELAELPEFATPDTDEIAAVTEVPAEVEAAVVEVEASEVDPVPVVEGKAVEEQTVAKEAPLVLEDTTVPAQVQQEAATPAAVAEGEQQAKPAPAEVLAEQGQRLRRPQQEVAHTKATAPKATPEVTAAPQRQEAKEAAQLENFHDIIPASDKQSAMSEEEQEKVRQDLQQIAAATQVKTPVASKVSSALLEGLKSSNAEMARQVESARSQQLPQGSAQGRATEAPKFTAANKGQKSAGARYTERFEDLKAKIVEQIQVRLKTAVQGKVTKVTVQLNPKYLGKVEVNMTLDDDVAKATFIVETQTVRELLQRSIGDLERGLSKHGLNADSIDIEVANDSNTNGDSSGRAFHSAEDQRIAKEWLASFHNFLGGPLEDDEHDVSSNILEEDENQAINILV